MNHTTRRTKTFIGMMVVAALASTIYAGLGSHTLHTYYALALLALAAATSRMKVKLPGIDGNMSVNLPFLLVAVVNLSAMEAILIALSPPSCSAGRNRARSFGRNRWCSISA